jgi:gluconolactonase
LILPPDAIVDPTNLYASFKSESPSDGSFPEALRASPAPAALRLLQENIMNLLLRRLGSFIVAAGTVFFPYLVQAEPPADDKRHQLTEICSGNACTWQKVAQCSGFIEGINFDASGQMWLVGVVSGEIMQVRNGACTAVASTGGSSNGGKFAPDGRLIMTDRKKGILAFDPVTKKIDALFSTYDGQPLKAVNDLIFDAKGGFYFTDPGGSDALSRSGTVYYVAPGEGSQPEVFAHDLSYPNGIALSPDGQIVYVNEFTENRIVGLPSITSKDPFGVPYVFARLQGGIGPDGVAVDTGGNVYAMHYGAGEVAIFDSQGFPYGTIRLPTGTKAGTTNLAFRQGYLYVTESLGNEIWRLPVKTTGLNEHR